MAGKFQVVQQAFELSVRIFLCTLPRYRVNTRVMKKMRVISRPCDTSSSEVKWIWRSKISSVSLRYNNVVRSFVECPCWSAPDTATVALAACHVLRSRGTKLRLRPKCYRSRKIAIFVSPVPPESCWEINAVEGSSCFEIRIFVIFFLWRCRTELPGFQAHRGAYLHALHAGAICKGALV